jgi:hypothetical protein
MTETITALVSKEFVKQYGAEFTAVGARAGPKQEHV